MLVIRLVLMAVVEILRMPKCHSLFYTTITIGWLVGMAQGMLRKGIKTYWKRSWELGNPEREKIHNLNVWIFPVLFSAEFPLSIKDIKTIKSVSLFSTILLYVRTLKVLFWWTSSLILLIFYWQFLWD